MAHVRLRSECCVGRWWVYGSRAILVSIESSTPVISGCHSTVLSRRLLAGVGFIG